MGRHLFHPQVDDEALRRAVEMRLRAFAIDSHPAHAIAAYLAVYEAGMVPGAPVLSAVYEVLKRVASRSGHLAITFPKRGGHCQPGDTLRQLAVLDALRELLGGPDVPQILPRGMLAKLAERFGSTKAAMGELVKRIRTLPNVRTSAISRLRR